MNRLISAVLATVFGAQIATAQQTISGRITNGDSQPVEFANIVVLTNDSAFAGGTVSDLDGNFSLTQPADAQYINISSVGYETFYKKISEITDFQNITLKTATTKLDEVTVKAIMPKTQMKDGALVTNIQGSVLAQTMSVGRMLGNIPGLVYKSDGSIEVLGKGKPDIYLNNIKVYNLSELDNIAPENVKNVEVITSPGARYAANVYAVVKINTLKPVGEGFGGSLEAKAGKGLDNRFSDAKTQAVVNYRKKGLDLSGVFRYSKSHVKGEQTDYTLNNSNYKWENDNQLKSDNESDSIPMELRMNYQVNDMNSFGIKYNTILHTNATAAAFNELDVTKDGLLYDRIQTQTDKNTLKNTGHSLNAYYTGILGSFSVDFNADFVNNRNENETITPETSENFENREIVTRSETTSKLVAQKLVVGHALLGGKIDFGFETTFTDRNDKTTSCNEQYVPSIASEAKQTGFAGFAEYSLGFAQIYSLKAGLRYEHIKSDYYGNGVKDNDASKVYNELFPSISLSRPLGRLGMISLAYNEKISRPAYMALSNNVFYASRYLQQTGNPKLQPSIIRELSFTGAYIFLQGIVTYQNIKNSYNQYTIVNTEHPESEILYWENTDKQQLTAMVAAMLPLGQYQPTIIGTMQKQWLECDFNGVKIDMNKPIFQLQVNNALRLKNDLTINLNASLLRKGGYSNLVEINRATQKVDFFVYKSFFNKALNIEAGIEDIFNKSNLEVKLYKQSGYILETQNADTRRVWLTVKYNFNPAKSKYKGKGAGNDEKMRL